VRSRLSRKSPVRLRSCGRVVAHFTAVEGWLVGWFVFVFVFVFVVVYLYTYIYSKHHVCLCLTYLS